MNPNLGQSDSQSPHLKQTGYEKLNQTQKGDDPKNISDPSPTGSKNSDGGQRKIDSIGFLEPAGVAKDPQIVNRVADHLTYVAFFSYRVKSNGSLIPLKDKKALQATKKSRAKPMLVITNFANGTFSSDLGHMILTNPQAKTRLIRNVVSVMKKKNYAALNIDFEHLLPEDRDRYTAFLKRLVPRLHAAGFPVSTSLAPKKSSKQTGSWYSAHDYGAHGKLMDFVILMTYEWGWTGGPPMAVAPIDKVKEVLDYAVTEIPRNKIIMGMPLYGYDWTLPYKKGGPPAKRLGFREAASLAKKEGVNVQYDPNAQSPFFRYTDNQGQKHVVWFENQKSLQAKFNLVKQYHLRGVSYWELGQPSPQNWKLLKQNFRIRQR
ncbi:MAG TPA: glycosyl hydrolase family 18 protein [Bacillales bacterium]|nr:glycosyl hydrolase family 18 protein [Bacillales bacterium]